ncbi:hypothetical protein [Tomitella biformata]|uniref:hypothetical protein n=1 Tax=Tomitella biformata TaxID=630403 RepID=UPI000465737D|nr:hypothetical protein [Tomitella biformata]
MARRNKSRGNSDRRGSTGHHEPTDRPAFSDSFGRREAGPGGLDYNVRTIPGSRATKIYRCPGCDQSIVVGVAHVVVWPEDAFGGGDDRRHWHTGCWGGRGTRSITRRWS